MATRPRRRPGLVFRVPGPQHLLVRPGLPEGRGHVGVHLPLPGVGAKAAAGAQLEPGLAGGGEQLAQRLDSGGVVGGGDVGKVGVSEEAADDGWEFLQAA